MYINIKNRTYFWKYPSVLHEKFVTELYAIADKDR